MPSINDVPEALRGLAALGRRDDLNLRPVLLRVMTDLFVAKSHHAPEEIHQFEEIALHMLGSIDGETRAAIASKLAAYGVTPATVIERLVACGGRAAAITLEMSRSVDSRALLAAACFGEADLAVAVAQRPDLEPEAIHALVEREESAVLIALASNMSIPLSRQLSSLLMRRARDDLLLAATLLERIDDPEEAAPLFLAADARQRGAIILAAKRRALGRPRQVPPTPDSFLLDRLEKLASQPSRRPFAAALATTTGARIADMDIVVNDTGGEPLALVLAALGMRAEAATRIFLMSDPAISHSYPRVAALRQLVDDITPQTARRLVIRFLDIVRRAPHYIAATDNSADATPSRAGSMASYARTRPQVVGEARLLRLDHDAFRANRPKRI
ncbi:MAG TPA: hypothetical protein VG271_19185 [Beijerinckiaceae bacterium]|nr:hypothetical protein [Beijerinckiaceae bacterium]